MALPLDAVAALFLERQQLDRPRGRRLTAASLADFAAAVGGIQLDSINVVDRAHHLTLWSRFGPFDRARFERLAYRERVLFEYWAHAACLVATTQLPQWRRAMLDFHIRHTGWTTWLRKNRGPLAEVEAAIRERGPLANADFQRPRRRRSAGWWSWKPATHALHYLWMTGTILVESRVHFQKRYDLAERLYPVNGLEPPSTEEFRRWHLRRSLHAMGAATELDLRMYMTFPRQPVGTRAKTLKALLASGEVVEAAVEGSRARWLALAEDRPALEAAAGQGSPSRGTTLLSPFDSLLWHRERAKRLFGFDYRIEVYTPGPKRTHGYYTMPILHDGQLVGRVDAKNHREERRLEVRSVHFERWLALGQAPPAARWGATRADTGATLAGLAETLGSLATFLGAERLTLGRVAPARLRPALARALQSRGAGTGRAAAVTVG
jgi:uncharacterized protein